MPDDTGIKVLTRTKSVFEAGELEARVASAKDLIQISVAEAGKVQARIIF